jgi:hypothetical protein
MREKPEQQMRAYTLDISQTEGDGAFLCPCCGIKISPDDHSEATYTIVGTKLVGNDLDEVEIECKVCSGLIHLGEFSKIPRNIEEKVECKRSFKKTKRRDNS